MYLQEIQQLTKSGHTSPQVTFTKHPNTCHSPISTLLNTLYSRYTPTSQLKDLFSSTSTVLLLPQSHSPPNSATTSIPPPLQQPGKQSGMSIPSSQQLVGNMTTHGNPQPQARNTTGRPSPTGSKNGKPDVLGSETSYSRSY